MSTKKFEVIWSVPKGCGDISDLPDEGTIDEIKEVCQSKKIKAILFDEDGLCCGGISPVGDYKDMVFM